eukprot:13778965-Alexandrium_andersonii.AAC.1
MSTSAVRIGYVGTSRGESYPCLWPRRPRGKPAPLPATEAVSETFHGRLLTGAVPIRRRVH